MSESVYLQFIKAPDERWKQMKAAYDSCKAAKIRAPDEVRKYFNYESPDDKGVLIDADDYVQEECLQGCDGYTVATSDIPEDVTHVRFLYCR